MSKQLGITVLPEWAQVEGVGPLLDNLQGRAGATAIATSPYVLAPADEATGVREPEQVKVALDTGASGYLVKPFDLLSLRRQLESVLPLAA